MVGKRLGFSVTRLRKRFGVTHHAYPPVAVLGFWRSPDHAVGPLKTRGSDGVLPSVLRENCPFTQRT